MTDVQAALRGALERGNFEEFAGIYAPDAVLELSIQGARSVLAGAAAAAAGLGRLFPAAGKLVEWRAQASEHGLALWVEVSTGDGRALRQRQYLHVSDGAVARHWIYSAPPRSSEPLPEEDDAGRRAVEQVGPVEHQEVLASTGWSGARLERAVLRDGRKVVAKRLAPGGDWLGRQSGDRGREALLQRDLLHRLPPEIDTAVIATVEQEDGWWLVMRDVSDELLDMTRPITRDEHRLTMRAANAMWSEFWGEEVPHVMSQANRLHLCSTEMSRRERDGLDLLPKQFESAWEAFAEEVEPDVARAVIACVEDPRQLATRLEPHGSTLLHGDIRDEQMGFPGGRLLLLDWGVATQGHPAVELAWYMCHCAWRIAATHDQIVEDFRRARGDADDPEALALGLFCGLVQYGWILGLAARIHTEPAERAWARSELDWWVPRARKCLEGVWAP